MSNQVKVTQSLVDGIAADIVTRGIDPDHIAAGTVRVEGNRAFLPTHRQGRISTNVTVHKTGRVEVHAVAGLKARRATAFHGDPAALWQQVTSTQPQAVRMDYYTADSDRIGDPREQWGDSETILAADSTEQAFDKAVDLFKDLLEDDHSTDVTVTVHERPQLTPREIVAEVTYLDSDDEQRTDYLIAEIHEIEPAA